MSDSDVTATRVLETLAGYIEKEECILFNFSGHGLLDLAAYERYLSGELFDHSLSQEEIEQSIECLKGFPKPAKISNL